MQLFITHYMQEGNKITITEERVLHQLTKVLRAKIGDKITVQHEGKRILCEISALEKQYIGAVVIQEEKKELSDDKRYLAVALPNKFEKAELIVQKCTEMGVQHIIFFSAKYSLIKEISVPKMDRLQKISLEAVEQSRGRHLPEIIFTEDVFAFCEGKIFFIAHQDGNSITKNIGPMTYEGGAIVLVGPEGGRHNDEEQNFEEMHAEKISFGETVLRMETASIIAGRSLKTFL